MAQIAEPSPSAAPSPKQLGRQLRQVRKQKGLSRSEVARSAGLTRRELAAYERGKVAVPESDLWCLAGSCGVDVGELLPNRDPLLISSDLSSLTVGNSIRHLRATQERDGVLREYLSMIYELRNLPPGSRVPLRETDLSTLADALGGSPDLIEQRLVELIGASREEAARLRAMILPPLSLPAPAASSSYDPDTEQMRPQAFDPAAAAEQFFSTPRAEDPFAKPPADDTLAPAPHIDAFLGNAIEDPFAPADPFAAAAPDAFAEPDAFADLNAFATDVFAPPSGAPLSTAPPEADPFATLPGEFGAEADSGDEGPIVNPFAELPTGMEIDDPFGTRSAAPATDHTTGDHTTGDDATGDHTTADHTFTGEPSLTMDPFGAAFEASVTPLHPSDLLPHAVDSADSPVDSADSPVDSPVDSHADSFVDSADSPGDSHVDSFGPVAEMVVDDEAAAGNDASGWAYDAPSTAGDTADGFADWTTLSPGDSPEGATHDSDDSWATGSMTDAATTESDPFGFATAPVGQTPDFLDAAATPPTDPFGFAGAPADDLADDWADPSVAADDLAPVEPSPFGISVPSLEELLATAAGELSGETHDFPAGDGWRELPVEPAPRFEQSSDQPFRHSFGHSFGESSGPEHDEFDALSTAFGVTGDPEAVPLDEFGLPTGDDRDGDAPMAALRNGSEPGPEMMADGEWFTPFDEPTEASDLVTDSAMTDSAMTDLGIPVTPVADAYVLETLAGEEPDPFEYTSAFESRETTELEPEATVPVDEIPFTEAPTDEPPVDEAPDAVEPGAVEPSPMIDDEYLVPIAWAATVPTTSNGHGPGSNGQAAPVEIAAEPEPEPEPEPELVFVTAGPDWQVGGIFPATAGADGTLSLRRADVRWALADITAEGDCTIEAVVDFTTGAGFGVLFRASVDGAERLTAYSFDVEPAYSGGSYLVRQWIESKQHWKPLAQAPVVDPSILYGHRTLRLALTADELVVTVDDETVLTVADLGQCSTDLGREPCRGDRLGVQAWSTTEVTVDTFRVARH